MMKTGTLTYVRRSIAVAAAIEREYPLYTVIRETGTGRRHRIPTATLAGESHYGYVRFVR